ncbi:MULTISPECIES: HD domain-containing phosphohydrolase [Brevibacillus]|uniref:Metal dependent phosphohydrolase n=2 Tax=Brevibacillus borstelensis TaxID=45462 RepID=M8DYR4_9BACL|nr:HD domain-containing phosphohydrolase [Brevibacillus borstelensis]EMT52151.1 metal dependent phosphohydrolase [Brevibacillus borstelensis AK1]MBE5394100.1 cache domain-containing protein [Brevibacillus borstelensis]MCC0565670.1 cache domain-containing protein [Brevibacillus borstelensis]MCM3559559.1 cache domain-containing protein [Brevibacillus borstelensis]MCM3592828.1 cache domain-containing protein [Brevibacillus borstelensis]
MRKGRSALPSKTTQTTITRLYPLFLMLLPIIFSVIVFFGYSQTKLLYYQNEVQAMDRQLNSVFQILSLFDKRVKDNSITRTEAQESAKKLLAGTRLPDGTRNTNDVELTLSSGDAFIVFNSQGNLLVHPHLEGQNMFQLSDADGRTLVREVLHKGKTVITYPSLDPTTETRDTKIAVARYFPEWDWHVSLTTAESDFYHQLSLLKSLLVLLVLGSYLITAFLFYNTKRKDKALLSSTLRGQQLAETNQGILKTLAVALEERDSYTSGHSQRVAFYMRVIGQSMNLDEKTLDTMYTGGLLHDIGKIGIEDSILLKPGRLTDEEYEIIRSHPIRGEALLKRLYADAGRQNSAEIDAILCITRHHHERYDGKGYPDQLAGEEIPLLARVAAVADSFDAMTSSRAYRKGLSYSKACDEIIRNAGTQFCPEVVAAFFRCMTEETFFHAHHISRVTEMIDRIHDKNGMPYIHRVSS